MHVKFNIYKHIKMKTKFQAFLLAASVITLLIVIPQPSLIKQISIHMENRDSLTTLKKLGVIAHRGGSLSHHRDNTLKAMSSSYAKGHRFFEIDLSWTRDGNLVATHDWRSLPANPRLSEIDKRPALDELPNLAGYKIPTLVEICAWINSHHDAQLITDVKAYRMKSIELIKETCGTKRIIIQIHNKGEYNHATAHGFNQIILSRYTEENHPGNTYEFIRENNVLGISIPHEFVPYYDLNKIPKNICPLSHTINQDEVMKSLLNKGYCAVYTDTLSPEKDPR